MNNFNNLFEEQTNDYWSWTNSKKEIAFLISDQHFIPTGGIGQFAYAFYQMCLRKHYRVHFILDKRPTKDNFVKLFDKARFHYTDDPISYKIHNETYLHDDTLNMYKCANFHASIVKAKQVTGLDFDLYLCNTNESILPAYSDNCRPLVIYTHLYRHIYKNSKPGKFTKQFHTLIDHLSDLPDVYLATQNDINRKELLKYHKNVITMPIPMPERSFLDSYDRSLENTKGVLFVGRNELGKRPDKFLQYCSIAQVPVKILTSRKSAIKLEEKCKKYGITDYEIKHSLTGIDKLNFMLSSRIMFNTSEHESYSIATYECIGHMPVLTLDDQKWVKNFSSKYLIQCNKDNIVENLKSYHDMPVTKEFFPKTWYQNGSLDYVNMLDQESYDIENNDLYGLA